MHAPATSTGQLAMSESIGAKELATLAKRRGLHVPAAEHRVDRRGFWQFFEVRERWGGADPRKYEDITLWFQGKNDTPGTPQGAQVWLDLCRWCGHDPRPYNTIAVTDQWKLSVEHWFSQCMAGDWSVLRNGLMGLFAVELGFNNSAEFKTSDSLAEVAFLGQRSHRNHRAFINWLHTKRNNQLPSLAFLQSTHCVDTALATPVYLSSGLRATGRTRQLYLPFGAAQGLRSAVKRARVEEVEVDEASEKPPSTRDASCSTDAPPAKRTCSVEVQTDEDIPWNLRHELECARCHIQRLETEKCALKFNHRQAARTNKLLLETVQTLGSLSERPHSSLDYDSDSSTASTTFPASRCVEQCKDMAQTKYKLNWIMTELNKNCAHELARRIPRNYQLEFSKWHSSSPRNDDGTGQSTEMGASSDGGWRSGFFLDNRPLEEDPPYNWISSRPGRIFLYGADTERLQRTTFCAVLSRVIPVPGCGNDDLT